MQKIIVEFGIKKRLMDCMKVSHVTIRESLRGNVKTELGIKIRKLAIEMGGVELKSTNNK